MIDRSLEWVRVNTLLAVKIGVVLTLVAMMLVVVSSLEAVERTSIHPVLQQQCATNEYRQQTGLNEAGEFVGYEPVHPSVEAFCKSL